MIEQVSYHFRLYVVNSSFAGKRAITNFKKIFEIFDEKQIKLEIVDILKNPTMAESDRIIAVPALLRLSPAPTLKIIGDLNDITSVRSFFGFDQITP